MHLFWFSRATSVQESATKPRDGNSLFASSKRLRAQQAAEAAAWDLKACKTCLGTKMNIQADIRRVPPVMS